MDVDLLEREIGKLERQQREVQQRLKALEAQRLKERGREPGEILEEEVTNGDKSEGSHHDKSSSRGDIAKSHTSDRNLDRRDVGRDRSPERCDANANTDSTKILLTSFVPLSRVGKKRPFEGGRASPPRRRQKVVSIP